MSDQQSLAETPITDDALVIEYLLENPDFFVVHADLLTQLEIPHVTGGAVSLVERQIEVYREKSQRLEKQLKELLDVARENERISQLLHQFAINMMTVQSSAAVLKLTRSAVVRDFNTDEIRIQLFDNDATIDAAFADMTPSRSVVCGKLTAQQRAKLFEDPDEIRSVALILLHAEGENLGVMALGSKQANRFHAGKGILFLSQLGNLVSNRLMSFR